MTYEEFNSLAFDLYSELGKRTEVDVGQDNIEGLALVTPEKAKRTLKNILIKHREMVFEECLNAIDDIITVKYPKYVNTSSKKMAFYKAQTAMHVRYVRILEKLKFTNMPKFDGI